MASAPSLGSSGKLLIQLSGHTLDHPCGITATDRQVRLQTESAYSEVLG